ncbi:MAG TPA: hypothetical protein VKG79_07375, partial [Bryobacteraceae bacterium]|nr:hypothetical protein [Bryobacteraceae bacterium]
MSGTPFPLTRNQIELYFEQLLNPGTTIFHIGAIIRISGPLKLDLFLSAVRAGWQRFPELATSVFEVDGATVQSAPETADPEL